MLKEKEDWKRLAGSIARQLGVRVVSFDPYVIVYYLGENSRLSKGLAKRILERIKEGKRGT